MMKEMKKAKEQALFEKKKKQEKKEKEEAVEKSFKFYDETEETKHQGILEKNMLKKEPEKALPDYKIKEILSYGDKVSDQSEGSKLK